MDVAEELLCAEAGIPLPVLRKAEFSHQDMSHLTHAADRLAKRPVEIHAPRTLSDSEVKRRILAFAAKSFEGDIIDRKLVIIDDVQEMTMEGHQCSFCGTRTSGYAGALRETIADTNVTIVAAVRLDDTTRHTSRLVPGMPWPWDANHDADLVLSLSFSEEEASLVGAKLCAEFYRNPAGIMGSLEVSLEALNGQRFPTWMAEGMDGD